MTCQWNIRVEDTSIAINLNKFLFWFVVDSIYDGMNNVEMNDTQVADNMYAESNNFIPNMIFQQYGMDINTTGGNDYISNPTNDYILSDIKI